MNLAHFNSLDVHSERHDAQSDRTLRKDSFTSTMSNNSNPTPMLYMPVASPPTPAPSPGPSPSSYSNLPDSFAQHFSYDPAHLSRREFASLLPSLRRQYLASLLGDCTPSELLFVSTTIAPLLKRDFLRELPPEIALHILSFVDDPKTLVRASQVSRWWRAITADEWMWKRMCGSFRFAADDVVIDSSDAADDDHDKRLVEDTGVDLSLEWFTSRSRPDRKQQKSAMSDLPLHHPSEFLHPSFSYRKYFKQSYSTMMNWRHGGHLLRAHRVPLVSSDSGVVTSVAMDAEWAIVGLANSKIHVFSVTTGVLCRTLIGHDLGVWAVNLVSRGGFLWECGVGGRGKGAGRGRGRGGRNEQGRSDGGDVANVTMEGPVNEHEGYAEGLGGNVPLSLRNALGLDLPKVSRKAAADTAEERARRKSLCPDPGKRSDVCCASEGWGQPNALVVSGGCDKVLRVWDVKSGYCIYILQGHTSTIRCIKVLHNRPIAVTGSRDTTLRVWDVQRGRPLRVLQGHSQSVRCLDVCGNRIVSGSYDTTCRLWDVDTGQCLHILQGHFHQIYSVAFDGVRIASGGLDTTVRIWDAGTGQCVALLQGHTALVCQLQLSPTILATGGSDGRVITFSLSTFSAVHRIAAHDSSVTSLQFDQHFLVTGGNDGRVRLFETETGNYVRELSDPSESVWKVVYRKDTCAVMCKRAGKTAVEIWSYKPRTEV